MFPTTAPFPYGWHHGVDLNASVVQYSIRQTVGSGVMSDSARTVRHGSSSVRKNMVGRGISSFVSRNPSCLFHASLVTRWW